VSTTTPTGQADLPDDPVAAIVEVVARLEPDLDREVVPAAVWQVAPSRTRRRRLAEAIAADPQVLTDGRSSAPLVVGQLVRALRPLGAARLVTPCCADCGQAARLRSRRGGERICDPCAARARDQTTTCSACGRQRRATHLDRHGQPRCRDCPPEEPDPLASIRASIARLEPTLPTAAVTGAIQRAAPAPAQRRRLAWALQDTPGLLSGMAASGPPAVLRLIAELGRLGATRVIPPACPRCGRVVRLGAVHDGQRLCGACSQRLRATPCAGCGAVRAPATRDADGRPRCSRCQQTNPANLEACAGCLPGRDERLARLERWIAQTIATIDDPDDQRLLRAFAGWHLVGRLRRRLGDGHATGEQTARVRASLRAAGQFLAWLRPEGLSLATCRQADIDRWLATGSRTRHNARDFVGWALARRLAVDLDLPPRPTAAATRPIDADQRWTTARRLLSDTDLDPADRVAGLLVLCYAQPVTTIARLSLDRITHGPGGVHLLLGAAPALLPKPLADLVLELAATRKGHATVGSPPTSPWLLPGGTPGRPIGADRLAIRLGRLGVPARPGRAAALTDLAAHLPVGVLARLLGISPSAATSWRTSAGGTWSGDAAELTQRGQPSPAGHPAGDS
jgi:hypothetical protein